MHIKVLSYTLLRMSKKHALNIDKTSIEAIGIDDFAIKKYTYVTVIVDLNTGKVVELLDSRETIDVDG